MGVRVGVTQSFLTATLEIIAPRTSRLPQPIIARSSPTGSRSAAASAAAASAAAAPCGEVPCGLLGLGSGLGLGLGLGLGPGVRG